VSETASTEESDVVGRALADELDALFRDDDLWPAIESPGAGGQTPEELATRAIHLYGLTSPILAQTFAEPADPMAYALGLLRDVADSCAILTRRWSAEDQAGLSLMRRSDLEAAVRRFDIDRSASLHGVELPLRPVPDEAALAFQVEVEGRWDEFSEQGLASRWSSAIETFRAAAKLRSIGDDEARTAVQGPRLREGVGSGIALSRMWVAWARQSSETGLIAVAVSLLLAAQGSFVACWDPDHQGAFFPDDDYLREFLQLEGGTSWLRDHGAEVPMPVRSFRSSSSSPQPRSEETDTCIRSWNLVEGVNPSSSAPAAVDRTIETVRRSTR